MYTFICYGAKLTWKVPAKSSRVSVYIECEYTECVVEAREQSAGRGEERPEPEVGRVESAGPAPSYPVSVYSNTQWGNQQQRYTCTLLSNEANSLTNLPTSSERSMTENTERSWTHTNCFCIFSSTSLAGSSSLSTYLHTDIH